MSGPTEFRTSESSEKSRPVAFTWSVAARMLPLIERIVSEILTRRRCLAGMYPEKARLDRRRRDLTWPDRSRRYQLQEEIATEEQNLTSARAELEFLGVALLDDDGEVGFPTVVNDQAAFFSWKPGEKELRYWHFPNDTQRRTIPVAWTKSESWKRGRS
jgi:hypothetical protein